tara:strand:- start:560 stop:1036 length:477 start_codon:yes stop_codon:yes gene_type:complete
MSVFINRKNFYLLIILFSIFVLISALYIEFILGYSACKLCLYQRIPFIISIFISFIGYYFIKNDIILISLIITFSISAIISGYHVGIENNIFDELKTCSAQDLGNINKENILNNLDKMPVNCKNVNFTILGLSLSTINFLSSLFITIYSIRTLVYEKN